MYENVHACMLVYKCVNVDIKYKQNGVFAAACLTKTLVYKSKIR